jgi:hypothetical protein
MDMDAEAAALPAPERVLLAVGEKDLASALAAVPPPWRERLVLLQNELLPRDWQAAGLDAPTVISVWFEKKPGRDAKVVVPSPVFGPGARLIHDALATLSLPSVILRDADALRYELVRKNLYILTTNIAGLETGGNVRQLWEDHEDLARAVASDVLDLQDALTGVENPRERLIRGMLEAFEGDPNHQCMGRSAPARLARALGLAKREGLEVATLRSIAASHDVIA